MYCPLFLVWFFFASKQVAGLAPSNLRVIKASAANVYALSEEDVAAAVREVQEQGLVPFFICANVRASSYLCWSPVPPHASVEQPET